MEKVDIVNNAIDTARALGISRPKVAVLAAVEKVNPNMQATIDAACLEKMCETGAFGDAVVAGPLAFDNAISERAANVKGINSEVAGHADIILVPTIEVGNALGKAIGYIGKASNAGIVVGAKAPIVLPSRAGKPEAKWAALALGALLGRRM
jgi:phosphotransacetylase